MTLLYFTGNPPLSIILVVVNKCLKKTRDGLDRAIGRLVKSRLDHPIKFVSKQNRSNRGFLPEVDGGQASKDKVRVVC